MLPGPASAQLTPHDQAGDGDRLRLAHAVRAANGLFFERRVQCGLTKDLQSSAWPKLNSKVAILVQKAGKFNKLQHVQCSVAALTMCVPAVSVTPAPPAR
jgi:hypothetical protein